MNELLRQALSELADEDKHRLIYALNNDITLWVKLENQRFIGVNILQQSNMLIEATYNSWSCGVFNE